MLNTSVRRAARSCPNGSLPYRPASPSIAPFTSRAHQRRQSSSKPPIPPNNGSSTIPASSVKQVGASRAEKKPVAESRLAKRRAAKAEPVEEGHQINWTTHLPSVPNTDHIKQKDLSIAAFYATYRPISITGPGPKEAQIEDVDKIFQPRPKSKFRPGQTDVIYTLASALENLDQQIADKQTSQQESGASQKADIIKQLIQHNEASSQQGDGNQTINVRVPNGTVKLVIQEIQSRFRPFNKPPPPTPVSQQELDALEAEQAASEANEEALAGQLESQAEQQDSQDDPAFVEAAAALGRRHRRKIDAQMRGQEQPPPLQPKSLGDVPVAEVFRNRGESFSIDIDMQKGHFFTPHYDAEATAQPASTPRSVRGNRIRRGFGVPVRIPRRNKSGMKLISVKRQRRLKMKKHKYKKLMRKTRTIRKKEGRL